MKKKTIHLWAVKNVFSYILYLFYLRVILKSKESEYSKFKKILTRI